jgi:hypothetical protein
VCTHARISRLTLDEIYSLRFLEWKERGERREESRLAGNASQIEIFHNIPYLRMERRFLNDKIISK